MAKRLMIIFFLLVMAAILICILIYFYQNRLDAWVKDYVSEITVCEKISDEDGCFARDFCEGIYEPAVGESQTLSFKSCKRIEAKDLARLKIEKDLCQSTNGAWYRNKLGNFCVCPNSGQSLVFDKNKGCVSK